MITTNPAPIAAVPVTTETIRPKYKYLNFDATRAMIQLLDRPINTPEGCDCAMAAAKILAFALPLIAAVELVIMILLTPITFIANLYSTLDSTPAEPAAIQTNDFVLGDNAPPAPAMDLPQAQATGLKITLPPARNGTIGATTTTAEPTPTPAATPLPPVTPARAALLNQIQAFKKVKPAHQPQKPTPVGFTLPANNNGAAAANPPAVAPAGFNMVALRAGLRPAGQRPANNNGANTPPDNDPFAAARILARRAALTVGADSPKVGNDDAQEWK